MSIASFAAPLMFFFAIIMQVVGASLLPSTRGFTVIGLTLASLTAFAFSLFLMARLLVSGFNLSILVPVMTCTVPLGVLAVAFFVYGEPASVLKVVCLVGAILLVGVASAMS